MKKICIFILCTKLIVFAGCTTTTQSQFCIHVEEDLECPSLDEVNETIFPAEDCGGTHTQASELYERNDSVSIWEEDTDVDAQYDGCCYVTSYVSTIGVDCAQ